jgi:CDP-diacylglycerol--glycerol-3-phosphate 3-phosphatidyltransferase
MAIPLSLTLARLVLGPLALWLAWHGAPRAAFGYILVGGLISDYFDGVLARRLGVASDWLRRLDSNVDLVFYLCLAVAAYVLETETFRAAMPAVALLVGAEAVCVGASLAKFRVLPGTHTYSAKLYGLVLFVSFFGVLCYGWGAWACWLACCFGLITNGETLAIILLSRQAPVDVASVLPLLRNRG